MPATRLPETFFLLFIMQFFINILPPFWADRLTVYLQLMRADKPIGTYLLLWPTFWALWIAAEGLPPAHIVAAFALGTFLMRSAGCVINDYADRHFDGAVERTKTRPFAAGRVKEKEALLLTALLCLLTLLCLLPLNHLTWLMSLPALFLAISYPFTKRFFPLPQLYLGLAFSFGIPMAFAAVQNQVPAVAWLLFAANAAWTLAYDTIYAMSDKEDDLKIGIQTSAITFGRYDAAASMASHALFLLLMVWLGTLISARWPYWLALAYVLWHQLQQYLEIRRDDRWQHFRTFLSNNRIGWVVFVGLLAHYSAH